MQQKSYIVQSERCDDTQPFEKKIYDDNTVLEYVVRTLVRTVITHHQHAGSACGCRLSRSTTFPCHRRSCWMDAGVHVNLFV
jgi:hypothetical protein